MTKKQQQDDRVRKGMSFSVKLVGMIERIKEEHGYSTFSSVIHQAVIEMYKRLFPMYVDRRTISPADKLKEKKENEEAKRGLIEQDNIALCSALGGKVETTKKLGKVCVYYTYSRRQRYKQKVSLDLLNEDILNTQYSPSREKVEKLQAEGKVEY